MRQETYFYAGTKKIGSVPFLLSSLFVGMAVTFRGGSMEKTYEVTGWRYLFSSFAEDDQCLLVSVSETSVN